MVWKSFEPHLLCKLMVNVHLLYQLKDDNHLTFVNKTVLNVMNLKLIEIWGIWKAAMEIQVKALDCWCMAVCSLLWFFTFLMVLIPSDWSCIECNAFKALCDCWQMALCSLVLSCKLLVAWISKWWSYLERKFKAIVFVQILDQS